jgi:hypothetical protein
MSTNEDLELLVKSKYPVIYLESIDEIHTINQLRLLASRLNLIFYQWSLTEGLKKEYNKDPYYETKQPVKMLNQVLSLITPTEDGLVQRKPSLFVLKDFQKHLEDITTVRRFKDLINRFKSSKNTFVILSAEYKLPRDIETDSAHIIGGFPSEAEILALIKDTCAELQRTNEQALIDLNPDDMRKVLKALKGLSLPQIRNIVSQCFFDDSIFNIRDFKTIESNKKKIFDRGGLLEFCFTEDKDIIAGFDNLKCWLADRREAFSLDQSCPLPTPKGVLLMGVQGCGKSLAIKVIAKELGLPLYRLDVASLYSKYIGETEENLRKALMIVEKLSPMCLWIDEIEKAFAASDGDIDGGISQRILGTFLTWLQERKASAFLAATANNIYLLPPELLRKGRFDEIFFVDLPDEKARKTLFKIHLKKRGLRPDDFDIEKLAAAAEGFSGAEVEQAIISALYRASAGKEPISTKHIIEQVKSTKPLAVVKKEDIAALRIWAKERTVPV